MTKKDFVKFDSDTMQLHCNGEWVIANLGQIKHQLKKIELPEKGELTIDGESITKMDSAGAWLLTKWIAKLTSKHINIHLQNFSEQHQKLLEFSQEQKPTKKKITPEEQLNWIQLLGKFSLEQADEFYKFLNFIGALFFEGLYVIRHPSLIRWNTIASTINKAGTSAMPIIGLLSLMIGIVISYQMGNQLREYGANVFIVNLVGYSVLREFGPLLTAIILAGRTGSAFTAQLGLMKVNQEIDALNTVGLSPNELLIIPRLIGIFIVLPLLTIWADVFGIFGGMLMAQQVLGITWHDFFTRFQSEIPLRALLIGIGKAPVFALIIASASCFEGMRVRGTAENIGTRTTQSVVYAIFFIIVFNAIISNLLSMYKL